MTKKELLHSLISGVRFNVTSAGDWEFKVKQMNGKYRLILQRVR